MLGGEVIPKCPLAKWQMLRQGYGTSCDASLVQEPGARQTASPMQDRCPSLHEISK